MESMWFYLRNQISVSPLLGESSHCTRVNSQHPAVLQCLPRGSSGEFCCAGVCSPWDTGTDLAICAPGRENFAVTLADNWTKQITYFHEKLSRVLLACYPAPHSQQRGHREWASQSHRTGWREGNTSAAPSWVRPGNRIFPDSGSSLYFRKSCQQSVLTSAGMSFEYHKRRFLGNYICPGWFYLASATSHHTLLFLISTARKAKEAPVHIFPDILHGREQCSLHQQLLIPVLRAHTAWVELYQDIQSWF